MYPKKLKDGGTIYSFEAPDKLSFLGVQPKNSVFVYFYRDEKRHKRTLVHDNTISAHIIYDRIKYRCSTYRR